MEQTTQTQTKDLTENLPNDGFTAEGAAAGGITEDTRTTQELEAAYPDAQW